MLMICGKLEFVTGLLNHAVNYFSRTIYFPRVKEVVEGRRGEEADRAGGRGAADGAAACGGGGGGGGGRRGGGGRAGDAKDAGTL